MRLDSPRALNESFCAAATASASEQFELQHMRFTDDQLRDMTALCNRECMNGVERMAARIVSAHRSTLNSDIVASEKVLLLGVVDLLFAYAYDVRTTLGEPVKHAAGARRETDTDRRRLVLGDRMSSRRGPSPS